MSYVCQACCQMRNCRDDVRQACNCREDVCHVHSCRNAVLHVRNCPAMMCCSAQLPRCCTPGTGTSLLWPAGQVSQATEHEASGFCDSCKGTNAPPVPTARRLRGFLRASNACNLASVPMRMGSPAAPNSTRWLLPPGRQQLGGACFLARHLPLIKHHTAQHSTPAAPHSSSSVCRLDASNSAVRAFLAAMQLPR